MIIKKRNIFFSILGIVTIWLIWSNITLETTHIKIYSNKLPSEFNGYKIAQISDLHNAEFGKNNSDIINILKKEKPDIIALTGDLVEPDYKGMTENALSLIEQAVKIAPCYYVTGNNEPQLNDNYKIFENKLKEYGVIILHSQAIYLECNTQKIQLLGIDDPVYANKFSHIFGNTISTQLEMFTFDDNIYTILLSHRPEYFSVYVDFNIDLVLSGHVHGGQFRIPFLGGVLSPYKEFFPEYDAGLFTQDGTNMVVSRGIGNSIIPVRINNRPEIVIIELHNKNF